jgi:two-component system sensor histidine kinase RegB
VRLSLSLASSLTETHAALRMILILRSLALIGQACAVLGAVFLLNIGLTWLPMGLAWGLLAATNLYTLWRLSRSAPISQAELAAQLATDVAALTLQLMFSGGLANPFVLFYCLLVAVAAVLLSTSGALMITVLSLLGLLFNAWFSVSMRWPEELDASFWQRLGLLISLTLCLSMLAGFVMELSRAVRARAKALAAIRETLLRQERVVALGALAAGAAHELGTPLNTMSLLAEELSATATEPQAREDARLLSAQIRRCKDILARLSSTATSAMAPGASGTISAGEWVSQTAQDYGLLYPGIPITCQIDGGAADQALILSEPLYTQALITLLDNARALAKSKIAVRVSWQAGRVDVAVADDGPGFAAEVLERFAEPLVSQRAGGRGLGLFLARTAIKPLGGVLMAENLPAGGACVHLRLPDADHATALLSDEEDI